MNRLYRFLMLTAAWFGCFTLAQITAQNPDDPQPSNDKAKQTRTTNGQFTFPEKSESRERLRAVLDYLNRTNIPWVVVTSAAQDLLNSPSDSFFRMKDEQGNETGAVVSVKSKVNEILSTLPKEGRETYEQEYGPTAKELLRAAIQADYERGALAEVAMRYFHTRAGGQATLLLATMDLETGLSAEAAFGFQRLLARPDADEFVTPTVLLKAMTAYRRSNDPKLRSQADRLQEQLFLNFPRQGLSIYGRVFNAEQLLEALNQDAQRQRGTPTNEDFFANRLGNLSHTGTVSGGTPFLDPDTEVPMVYHRAGILKNGSEWMQLQLEEVYKNLDPTKGQVSLAGSHPITAKHMLIYRGYDGVYAIATKNDVVLNGRPRMAGELIWFSSSAGATQTIVGDDDREISRGWWESYWKKIQPQILTDNAANGSLSHDGRYVYVVDDLGILPPPTIRPGQQAFVQPGVPVANMANQTGVKGMLAYNRLIAIDLTTGMRKWILGGPEKTQLNEAEEAKLTNLAILTEGSFFLGPPVSINGKLYVLMERKNQILLVCMNPYAERVPELVWLQNIGEVSTTLMSDMFRRQQPAYLTYADGLLICPTNSGAIVAVDIYSRSLKWARFYGSLPDPNEGLGYGMPQRGRFPNNIDANSNTVNQERWRAAAPMIVGDKIIHTAYDSDQIQCLDLNTGEQIWAANREKDDLFVATVHQEIVMVVGKKFLRGYQLAGDGNGKYKLAWDKVSIGTPCGHGVATNGGIYFLPMISTADDGPNKQPQVWAIDVATGEIKSKTTQRPSNDPASDPRKQLGNLIFQDGQLISVSPISVKMFPLIELKRQQMADRLKTNPNDPEGLAARAELSLDQGELINAIKDFQIALKNQPSDATLKNIESKLYIAFTELARNKFEQAEPFLAEYEKLCNFAITTEDESERLAQLDEQLRRRSLYLVLVGRGKEKQGKLADAFAAYRAFSQIGENRQLVSIPDESSVMFRPDVWASGRIEWMMRQAKPGKPKDELTEQIQQEWAKILEANNPEQLREFARIFSIYFPVGREARFQLVDWLLQQAGEDEQREAQTLLLQLIASDAATQAEQGLATEKLALLMVSRGMLEDAVGLYAQLASKFNDVIIRDGKTGAEIYGDLLTDKRLLPYLEPSLNPPLTKYQIELNTPAVGMAAMRTIQIRPQGELYPFYQKLQFILESSPNNDGTWALRVVDPETGVDRCKFLGLNAMPNMNYNPATAGNTPNLKIAQASGRLLLLNIGPTSYCFDLAEKRLLWQQSLLPKNTALGRVQMTIDQRSGELLVEFDDGWKLKLERSTILMNNYVAILTKDGLKVIDPYSGHDLWSRKLKTANSTVQMFGDENYIFLLEGNKSLALRTSDGSVVSNVSDIVPLFSNAKSPKIYGRTILSDELNNGDRVFQLTDPLDGRQVWKRTFVGKSVALETVDPQLFGLLYEDGRCELVQGVNGKTIFEGKIDEDRLAEDLKPCFEKSTQPQKIMPLALLDQDRVYILLNRNSSNNSVYYGTMPQIQSQRVNGAIYAFDRSGKRIWYQSNILFDQQILLDRFNELPVLVAARMLLDSSMNLWQYRVVAIDKQTGKLKFNYNFSQNGGEFSAVNFLSQERAYEFLRPQDGLRLRIVAKE